MEAGLLRLHLPALQRVNICGLRDRGRLHLDRDSLLEAADLESLSLEGFENVTMMPDCLVGLTALATLDLMACGFVNIPAALTALQDSLTSLALGRNQNLQLADSDVTKLLTLQKLRMLHMGKRSLTDPGPLHTTAAVALSVHLHYVPAPWSERSLQHLVTLQSAFLRKHGVVLDLRVPVHVAHESDSDYLSDEDLAGEDGDDEDDNEVDG